MRASVDTTKPLLGTWKTHGSKMKDGDGEVYTAVLVVVTMVGYFAGTGPASDNVSVGVIVTGIGVTVLCL